MSRAGTLSTKARGSPNTPPPIAEKIPLFALARENDLQHRELSHHGAVTVSLSAVDNFPNKTIDKEVHETKTQYVIVVQGTALINVSSPPANESSSTRQKLVGAPFYESAHEFVIEEGEMAIIYAGVQHEIKQIGETPLKIVSMYVNQSTDAADY